MDFEKVARKIAIQNHAKVVLTLVIGERGSEEISHATQNILLV